mmetsp:Transcript_49068/g.87507  ORF Transcript_49068/g.87507 Transcript_49068/m.87507 type:complete len:91 (+) Transcript_49068:357-629(+)
MLALRAQDLQRCQISLRSYKVALFGKLSESQLSDKTATNQATLKARSPYLGLAEIACTQGRHSLSGGSAIHNSTLAQNSPAVAQHHLSQV